LLAYIYIYIYIYIYNSLKKFPNSSFNNHPTTERYTLCHPDTVSNIQRIR